MRRFIFVLILGLLVGIAHGQDEKPSPLMPEGAYGTTVQGGLAEGETRAYSLKAAAGQQLVVKLITLEDNVFLRISDQNGVSLLGDLPPSVRVRHLDLILPKSGDYELQVCAEADRCSYMLEVSLEDPPKPKEKKTSPDSFKSPEPSPPELSPVEPEEHPSANGL